MSHARTPNSTYSHSSLKIIFPLEVSCLFSIWISTGYSVLRRRNAAEELNHKVKRFQFHSWQIPNTSICKPNAWSKAPASIFRHLNTESCVQQPCKASISYPFPKNLCLNCLVSWCPVKSVQLVRNMWGEKKLDKTPISLSVSSSYRPKVSSSLNTWPWKEAIPYLAAVVRQKPASVQHMPGLRVLRHISPPSWHTQRLLEEESDVSGVG